MRARTVSIIYAQPVFVSATTGSTSFLMVAVGFLAKDRFAGTATAERERFNPSPPAGAVFLGFSPDRATAITWGEEIASRCSVPAEIYRSASGRAPGSSCSGYDETLPAVCDISLQLAYSSDRTLFLDSTCRSAVFPHDLSSDPSTARPDPRTDLSVIVRLRVVGCCAARLGRFPTLSTARRSADEPDVKRSIASWHQLAGGMDPARLAHPRAEDRGLVYVSLWIPDVRRHGCANGVAIIIRAHRPSWSGVPRGPRPRQSRDSS